MTQLAAARPVAAATTASAVFDGRGQRLLDEDVRAGLERRRA